MKRKNTSAHQLDKSLLNIYSNFKSFLDKNLKSKKFVIGVSGGPDSLALAYFAKIYSSEKKIDFTCIIIDHGVRKASEQEAKQVKNLLKKNRINLKILNNKKKIDRNIQGLARQVRYDMLKDYCLKKKRQPRIAPTLHHHATVEYFSVFVRSNLTFPI